MRTKFITHSDIQLRLAGKFMLLFFIFIAVFGVIYFLQFSNASGMTDGLSIHDKLITKMLLVNQSKQLAIWYGVAALCYIILCSIYLLIYSHRLTGPIYKLNLILDKAIKNRQFPKNVKFRKEDAFHDLAEKFNEFCEAMHPEQTIQVAPDLNPEILESPKE